MVVALLEESVKSARAAVKDEKVTAPEKVGVLSVGDVPKTAAPEPVSSVRAATRLALDAALSQAATLEPRPETPVPIGKPVALVSVKVDGVPRLGVVRVGLFAKTATPVPVSSESAARRFAEVRPFESRLATPLA